MLLVLASFLSQIRKLFPMANLNEFNEIIGKDRIMPLILGTSLEVKVVLAFTPQDLISLSEQDLVKLHKAIMIIQIGEL